MAFLGFGKKEDSVQRTLSGGKKKDESKPLVVKNAPKKEAKKTVKKDLSASKIKTKKVPAKPVRTGVRPGRKTLVKKEITTSVTDHSNVLIKPRITEKATIIAEEGRVYTFNVHPDATKKEIAKAVEKNFKVIPIKVNVSPIKRKKVMRRGKIGMTAGGKKAMVYLKEGDSIEFV